jgi:hypothetical protein
MTIEGAERYLRGADLFKWRELAKKAERERRQRDADLLDRVQAKIDAEERALPDHVRRSVTLTFEQVRDMHMASYAAEAKRRKRA